VYTFLKLFDAMRAIVSAWEEIQPLVIAYWLSKLDLFLKMQLKTKFPFRKR